MTLFVVTDNRFAKQSFHRRTVRQEEGFRALEIDTIIRKKLLFRVLKIDRVRVDLQVDVVQSFAVHYYLLLLIIIHCCLSLYFI